MLGDSLRAVTFDAGHTLLHPYPSLGELNAGATARHGVVMASAAIEGRFREAWLAARAAAPGLVYGTTHGEARDFWLGVVARVFRDSDVGRQRLKAILEDLYATFGRAAVWRVHPGWREVLVACRLRRLRVGLVSNWDVRLRRLLSELELLPDFEAVVISAEVGIEKPDPTIFGLAASRLGVRANELLHVGDAWAEDVAGARAAGARAVWLSSSGLPPAWEAGAVDVIRDLAELVPLLAESASAADPPGA